MTIQTETNKKIKTRNYQVLLQSDFSEDISNYILSIDISNSVTGDNYILSRMEPSVASMKVDNRTGYFNQDLSKIPVKILGGYGGENTELFRGFLRKDSITVKSKEVNLTAESYIQVFKKEIINKEVLLNYRIEEIVERACQECVTDGTIYDIYQSGIVIPVCDLSEFTLWSDLLKLLQESCLCVLVYEDRKIKFKEFYSDTEVSQYDFIVENIEDLTIQKSNDTVKNSIIINSEFKSICSKTTISDNYVNIQEIKNELYTIVEGTNNKIYTTQKPLYKSEELVDGVYQYTTDNSIYIVSGTDFGVKVNIVDIDIINGIITIDRNLQEGIIVSSNYQYQTMTLLPNQQREYIIELNESATDLQILCSAHQNVSAYDQGTPVSFSTIEAINTVHLTNTIEKKDNKIKFTLKNNTSEVITLSTLQLAGRPLKSFSPIKAKFINQPSITKYGEKPHEVTNNFIVSEDQALILGKFLWQNISNEPVKKITIPAMNLLGFVQIGKVTVTESSTSTTGDYLVSNIKHSMQLNDWQSSIEVIPYPSIVSELDAEWLGKTSSNEYMLNTLFVDKIPNPVANLDIKYNNNLDGTKNIALMWQYINDDSNPIDGYEIFINTSSTSGTFVPDYTEDIVFTVRPEQRGLVIRNIPLKETIDGTDFYKYYAFAIRPYRNVHPTLNSTKTKYFSGDGLENTFVVDFVPLVSQKETRTVKVDGVLKTEDVDFTVITETGSFVFTSSPLLGTNNIQIDYRHLYPDGYIKGDIQKFCDYSAIDTFTVYIGENIVKAINGPSENTSITTMAKIVNALEKDKKYASSLLFTDFKGITLEVLGIDRLICGQYKNNKYGIQIRNSAGDVVFTAGDLDSGTGIEIILEDGGVQITSANGITATRSDGKIKTVVNATNGIKIQQYNGVSWIDKFYADVNGNLTLEGQLVLTRSDGKVKVLIDANNGIKIQKYENSTWVDKIYADENGDLILDGQLTVGSVDSIPDGAIKTNKLNVLARNFINNFSTSGELTGWNNYSSGVLENVTKDGVLVKALKIATDGDVQVVSSQFDIDPTMSYKVTLSILGDSTNSDIGTRYFGFYAYDAEDNVLSVIPWVVSTKTFSTVTNNPYFWHGDISAGTWRDMTAYIVGCNTNANEIPEPKNITNCFKLPPNAVKLAIRFLNYYNAGTTITNWFFSPQVIRVDDGLITANRINVTDLSAITANLGTVTAGTLTADTIIVDDVTIASKSAGGIVDGLDGFGTSIDGVFNSTGNVTYNLAADDVYTLVKQYSSFTLNAGHTLTVDKRIKGLIILCGGDVVINGTINTSGKAAQISDPIGHTIQIPLGTIYMTIPRGGKGGAGGRGGHGYLSSNGGAGGTSTQGTWYGGSVGAGGGGAGGGGVQYSGGQSYIPCTGIGGTGGNCSADLIPGNGGSAVCIGSSTNGNPGGNCAGGSGSKGFTYASGSIPCSGAGGSNGGAGGGGSGATSYGSSNYYNGSAGGSNGGRGGATIIIIAKGNITIGATGIINASGAIGSSGGNGGAGQYNWWADGSATSYAGGGGGGQGGGGGGNVVILHRGTYSNSGTINVNGGTGGNGGISSSPYPSENGIAGSAGSIGSILVQAV